MEDASRLLRNLRDLVAIKLERMNLLGRFEPHLGDDYKNSSDPYANALQRRGASFDWVAFSLQSSLMWDLHVGAVLRPANRAVVGFHARDEAPFQAKETVARLGNDWGNSEYSWTVSEWQWNKEYRTDEAESINNISSVAASLCQRLDSLLSPSGIRVTPPEGPSSSPTLTADLVRERTRR